MNIPHHDDSVYAFDILAAIDFGTTHSGYAFSFNDDPEKKIYKSVWINDTTNKEYNKCPTTILFNPQGKFDSFGFQAESMYAELVDKKEHENWTCIKNFKMQLYEKSFASSLEVEDELGRMVPALKVFSESIRYLKETLCHTLQERCRVSEENILWVITVPAIWKESSKKFMRQSAIEAGIKNEHLTFALEPEAAALFCCHDSHILRSQDIKHVFSPGGVYMIIDLGGGTIDTTVHKVDENEALIEEVAASGGNWGGTSVDRHFQHYLEQTFGTAFIQKCKRNFAYDWLKFMSEFEVQKRGVSENLDKRFRLQIPPRFLFESDMKVNLSSYDKHDIPKEEVQTFFTKVTDNIVQHVSNVLEKVPECKVILMVGGFSQSKFVNQVMNSNFPKKIIIPILEAELAVLQGAIHFARNPKRILKRKVRHTFGLRLYKRFQNDLDHECYRKEIDGEILCSNRFVSVVQKNQTIELDKVHSIVTNSSHVSDSRKNIVMTFSLYISDSLFPRYTDNTCEQIGTIRVSPPPDGWPDKVEYRIEMMFGRTELTISVHNNVDNEEYKSSFEFPLDDR